MQRVSRRLQPGYCGPQRFFLRGKSNSQFQGFRGPQATGGTGPRFIRLYTVSLKVWAALAVALSMSVLGSAVLYQVAKYLMVPVHFDNAQVQEGVLVFWLLPSLCAAFCLLAAPVKKRGVA